MRIAPKRLSLGTKIVLVGRICCYYIADRLALRRHPLPEVVNRISQPPPMSRTLANPRRLGRIVSRVLRLGPWRARCLHTSLVLFRLLREQGDPAELVIGLPREPRDKDAHAWIEIDGFDVGPPPGRGRHQEIARYR